MTSHFERKLSQIITNKLNPNQDAASMDMDDNYKNVDGTQVPVGEQPSSFDY